MGEEGSAGGPHGEGGRAPVNGQRGFRVVTEQFADRIEIRVEEQEYYENFGWISRGDPSTYPRFRRVVRRQPGWLSRLHWCLRPDRARLEARFHTHYQRRLEQALFAAQVEANRRNTERRLIHTHLESVREVLGPGE
jgi:hypothetical protein